MVCDLCNTSVTAADGTRVPALVMRGAVLRGFNPFTTPGFENNASTLELLGVNLAGAAAEWRNRALTDDSDWMLCQSCHKRFVTHFGSVSGGAG